MQNYDNIYKNFDRILAAINRSSYFLAMIAQELNRFCPVNNQWFEYEKIEHDRMYEINTDFCVIHGVLARLISNDGSDHIWNMSLSFPSKYLEMQDNEITIDHYKSHLLDIIETMDSTKDSLEKQITNIQAAYKIAYDAYSKGIEIN